MKMKVLFTSLVLVLVLTILMPAVAIAAKPVTFNSNGVVTHISPGTVVDG